MSFSLSILLYIYLAFLVVWLFFMLAGIYHMIRFGFKGFITVITTLIFTAVAVLMLVASSNYIAQVDWEKQISFFTPVNIEKPNVIGY